MRFLCCIVLLMASCSLSAQEYWVQKDSIKGPGKSVACAMSINGNGYVLAGLTSSGFVRSMYSYDVNQDDWDDALSIGGLNGGGLSRGSACSFSVGGKGYICLGQGDNTDFLNDVWEYDPALDVWSQKANYQGSARRAAVAFVIGSLAYVGTGQDENGLTNDFYAYDPQSNSWTPIASFGGTARKYAIGFSMGNQGYVGTGNDGIMRADFWQYQPATNTWIQKSNFPSAREGAVAWGNFPNGYVACGEDQNNVYCNDVMCYNYYTDSWSTRPSLPGSGRKHAIAYMVGPVAYVGSGYNGDLLDDFFAYTMVTGINSVEYAEKISVYPVPATSFFIADFSQSGLHDLTVQLHDSNGQDVSSAFSITSEVNRIIVQTNGAATGNYSCSFIAGSGEIVATKRVLLVNE